MATIAIHGAAGRMGLRLVALSRGEDGLELMAAMDRSGHPSLGKDVGLLAGGEPMSVPLSDLLEARVDVLIDFTAPVACRAVLSRCVETGSNMVIGTTGLTEDDHGAIDEAARSIAILQAPNMSLGVNLLFTLAGQVAVRLGDDYDIEIVETHHRHKQDSPSGTALGLAESICAATGKDVQRTLVHGRQGDTLRRRGEIGMHSVRSGDVVGRHTVGFGALGEELQLTHIASTRDVFARGALRAAGWLADKSASRYRMADVLGI